MAHWLNAVDGSFNTKTNWSTGRVPVFNARHQDDAILNAVGGAYTVKVTSNEDVRSIQTLSNATLSLTGLHTFSVQGGTGAGANAGSILVGNGSTLNFIGGTVVNTGAISLKAGASNAFLDLQFSVVLQGGGAVVMGDNAFNGIVDTVMAANATLTNVDNTISGAGVIGSGGIPSGGTLTLINQAGGVINATGTDNALILNTPGATLTNNGLLEGTGAAGLDIASTTVDGSGGGVIRAGNLSVVRLEDTVIVGGTLTTAGTGVILAGAGGTTFDGTVSTVNIQGQVDILESDFVIAQGVINNTGTIALTGAGSGMELSKNLTLTGGGVFSLGDTAGNFIYSYTLAKTLTNVDNTITGDGQLGSGLLTLVNQSAGIIKETGASGLTIDTGSAAIINAGLIEAAGTGGVMIQSAVTNTGVIEASASATLSINSTVKNTGTILVNGGTINLYEVVTGNGSATISGAATLDCASAFNENVTFTGVNGLLELAQSQFYTKTVTGFRKSDGSFLDLDDITFVSSGEATFVDNGSHTGGVLTVTDGAHAAHINLVGDYHAATFVAASDGHGGVFVSSPATPVSQAAAAPSRFIAAMAGFGGDSHGPVSVMSEAPYARPAMLAVPRMAMA